MSIQVLEDEIVINFPSFEPLRLKKKDVESIEEVEPPEDVCQLVMKLREKGVIIAGSTIDGKISYYNITPGKKCKVIKMKDGRKIFVSE
ncbi:MULTISPECIES: hypothetical protein [Acidianus]|nr:MULTISPECIES: hypothetical protein [Acidianus]NON61707.1 hypothetical protein [Acidianus sp. RZ1]